MEVAATDNNLLSEFRRSETSQGAADSREEINRGAALPDLESKLPEDNSSSPGVVMSTSNILQTVEVSSYQENKRFLSLKFISREDFAREYRKLYSRKEKCAELYLVFFSELKNTISEGNIVSFIQLTNFADLINDIDNNVITLSECYNSNKNPIKNTNLIILACKYKRLTILECILQSNSNIFQNLYTGIGRTDILPDDKDEEQHNAFYYAIRSGNSRLLDVLITKWPGNYFSIHLEELDELLSKTYEELKLKNILLLNDMEIFVESKLIDLRFFSDPLRPGCNVKSNLNDVRERIDFVLECIDLIDNIHSSTIEVEENFLFIASFIAKNIHILKQQLKSTYDRLPWEEIEFCLVSFIASYAKKRKSDLFCRTTLNKSKIITHLQNFSNGLLGLKDILKGVNIKKFIELPKLNREEAVVAIVSNCPAFKELYEDYQQIRDIYSLEKIHDYAQLAMSTNPQQREGQLVITRVLQVIGEYLSNTLEFPNLSDSTGKLLFVSLPKNIRRIVIDLRNSLSYLYSLSKRTVSEENTDVNFFMGIKNDVIKFDDVITDVLLRKKIKVIRTLLEKIINSDDFSLIKDIAKIFSITKLDRIVSDDFKTLEFEKLQKLIKDVSNNITDMTNFEDIVFNKISLLIDCKEIHLEVNRNNFVKGLTCFESLSVKFCNDNFDQKDIKGLKFYASKVLKNIALPVESRKLKEVVHLSWKIFLSIRLRSVKQSSSLCMDSNPDEDHNNLYEIYRLFLELLNIVEVEMVNTEWIQEFREKFKVDECLFIPAFKQRRSLAIEDILSSRLSELKILLTNNGLCRENIKNYPSFNYNKKLQAAVEILVLDIMSILCFSATCLENNLLFLDDNAPLLSGKCFHDHLSHLHAIVDLLLFDPSVALILNANKLADENILLVKKRIGKLLKDDICKLKNRCSRSLDLIANQKRLFDAIEKGSLESMKACLKNGADLHARGTNSWSSLHFAAKGFSIEVITFILSHNIIVNVNDICGQSPLHIAAANGRTSIVDFFAKRASISVNEQDINGKTPLHIASQNGHVDTVKILSKYNSDITIRDAAGHSSIHYAVQNSHVEIAKFLLYNYNDVNISEIIDAYTLLHTASENGCLELVNFMLDEGANVNLKNDDKVAPLHLAALNGHSEVVKVLILKQADMISRAVGGYTPLHCAVKNDNKKTAVILLKYGASVDGADDMHNTPLHYAVRDGHEGLVDILLNSKANVNVTNSENRTPLHFAVKSGHYKIVECLLEHNADIQIKDNNKVEPLHCAAKFGRKAIAKILIEKGADVNGRTYCDFTSLHLASREGHKDVVELLLTYNAEVNSIDVTGSSPLHSAALSGKNDVIDFLIKNNANVNSKNYIGLTALHIAAGNGHKDTIDRLIKNEAEINFIPENGVSPLHTATIHGDIDIVSFLVKNKAKIDTRNACNCSPICTAIEAGHTEIVKIFAANGASINKECGHGLTPLCLAIEYNHKEIVEVLLTNGADVNKKPGEPLILAITNGLLDVVEILLKYKARVNAKDNINFTPLHIAAKGGVAEIVSALVSKGANINAAGVENITPLDIAALNGHEDVVKLLINKGANVNTRTHDGSTPLHAAALKGHKKVVKILLENKALVNIKNNMNRTALELAVCNGHLQVVKMLLPLRKVDINAKGNVGNSLLHIASQQSNLEIVKYLVNKGADINVKNTCGSKPIHVAVREGFLEIVKFFLSKGLNINEPDSEKQTLLHYAVKNGRLDIVKYLIKQRVFLNAEDYLGSTPLHIASMFNHVDIVEVLLENGAVYNAVCKFNNKCPIELTENKNIINLLSSTDKLFEAVKENNVSDVKRYVNNSACVNANNANNGILLHYAVWKGYNEIVKILLENHASPNLIGKKGCTSLHYASKLSRSEIVTALLANGAVFNAVSDYGKTPLDLSVDKSITDLLQLVEDSFKSVKDGNKNVINSLNKIVDVEKLKAVVCARNREYKTLLVVASDHNFPEVELLTKISQFDVSAEIDRAIQLVKEIKFEEALNVFTSAFQKLKENLGPDSPATLDVQIHIANVLYLQQAYQDSLTLLEEIFLRQCKILGANNRTTLLVRGTIALVLHRLGKDEESFDIFQEVFEKQKEVLGPDHLETLETHSHMALVVESLGRYEDSLKLSREVLERYEKVHGADHHLTVIAQSNLAAVLNNLGKRDEALKIFKEVFKVKEEIYGINNSDTRNTLRIIGKLLFSQKKYNEALEAFEKLLDIEIRLFGLNDPVTLETQFDIANVLLSDGKLYEAFKLFNKVLYLMKLVHGPNHPTIPKILNKLEYIKDTFKLQGLKEPHTPKCTLQDIRVAAGSGDLQTVQLLLEKGVDANGGDVDGRTPLHYAVNKGHVCIVKFLIKNGANVAQFSNKGNTPLHTATNKNYREIVDILLQNVSHDKLIDFIDAKTNSTGTASLHTAAENGCLEIVKSLLKYGATYDVKNNNGRTPIELSQEPKVKILLKLVEDLFKSASDGNLRVISKLKKVKRDEFDAVTNARNSQGNTLLQVLIINKYKNMASKLIDLLKKPHKNS